MSSYRCNNCSSIYDAEIFHDFEHNRHWWIGKRRNPEFWKMDNKTIEEGLMIIEVREKEGVKEYLGAYPIEEIKPEK